jgi:FkbM family methyltransferase
MEEQNNLVLKSLGKFSLFLDKNDPGISKTLIRSKFLKKWHREPEFMDIIENEVKEGDVAFDLGANIGYVTMFLAQFVGSTGKVYAVEPSPHNFKILNKSIDFNNLSNKVLTSQLAISSFTGKQDFNIAAETNLHSFAYTKHTKSTISVKTSTIDDFFVGKPFPNFIKMDIEGGEVEALAGMNKILKHNNTPLKILIEVHPMYYNGDAFKKQLQRLFNCGFKTKYLVTAGTGIPQYFKERGYKPKKIFKTGDFSRGVYEGVLNEHVIESCSLLFDDNYVNINWFSILKNPKRFFKRKVNSPKIVRSIMIEKID